MNLKLSKIEGNLDDMYYNIHPRYAKAATMIQSHYRGYKSREFTQNIQAILKSEERVTLLIKIINVQKRIKGFIHRKRV